MDAIEFLEEWPVERRGLPHAAACETCYAAYDGRKSLEAAQKTFMTWHAGSGSSRMPPWRHHG
ncbi:DUF982 domain-containing protein [Mesorhizobium sp.]|uniref:DUF982 domain-containing protein n=1 Tax=Mesorhizobium sp. TaxID=1871066 RepID=UPI0025BBCAAD|nr:DUF982 domain-containing protein [Mesorhizobium sp.]